MKIFKTLRSHRPSFSTDDNSINLTAPKSWKDLTQEQLRYVFFLLATFESHTMVKTYMFVRFTGINIIKKDRYGWQCYFKEHWYGKKHFFTIKAWQVVSLLHQFDYIDSYEDLGVRLEDVDGLRAVDVLLHGVRFIDYLNAEKYYQAYLAEQNDKYLNGLALILYRKKNVKEKDLEKNAMADRAKKIKMSAAELFGVFIWYSYIKFHFGKMFPYFFKKADKDDMEEFDIVESINIQIRALTDGDITKEQIIYNTPCWRALTELNSKAREAEEFDKKFNKNGE